MQELFNTLKLHPLARQVLLLLVQTAVTFFVLRLVLRLEQKVTRKLIEKNNNINAHYVDSVVRFILIMIAVTWVIMSSPLTQPFGRIVFQGTAIIGAIIGFAAQPVIADLICGLMISTTQPFNIGDRVELEDGTAGIVKDITLRHVVVQTIDTLQVVIPNSKVNGMRVTNMSFHTRTRSIHFRFNVAYDADLDAAKKLILRAVKECDHTVPRPDTQAYGPVYFLQFADSSLVLAVTAYYPPTVASEVVRDAINTRVKSLLEKADIEIPYNYVSVVMKDGDVK